MREGPQQRPLLETLLRIRCGEIIQTEWVSMNARYEGDLSELERQHFMHNKVINLYVTWNAEYEENCKTLNNLGVPIAAIPAINNGKHTDGKFENKQVGQIPPRALLAVGGRVILTKYQKGLTAHHYNGAMGTVVALIYAYGVRPPLFPCYVIINFAQYIGSIWCAGNPTWIPIVPEAGPCEYMCCTRTGLPLMPCYSMPIAKSQGSTIGAKQLVTHMRLKLQKEGHFKVLCPGTTYTGLSRVDKNSSWVLVDKIDWPRLSVINNHSTIKKRRDEVERLHNLHNNTIAKFNITGAE